MLSYQHKGSKRSRKQSKRKSTRRRSKRNFKRNTRRNTRKKRRTSGKKKRKMKMKGGYNIQGVEFEIDDKGVMTFNDKLKKIPEEFLHTLIKSDKDKITQIDFGKHIDEIGPHSFKNLVNLEKINLGNIKKINIYAFDGCNKLILSIKDDVRYNGGLLKKNDNITSLLNKSENLNIYNRILTHNTYTFDFEFYTNNFKYRWNNVNIKFYKLYFNIIWGNVINDPCINAQFLLINNPTKLLILDDFFYNRKYLENSNTDCFKLFTGNSRYIQTAKIGDVGMSLMIYLCKILKIKQIWLVDKHIKKRDKQPKADCSYYERFGFKKIEKEPECLLDLKFYENVEDILFLIKPNNYKEKTYDLGEFKTITQEDSTYMTESTIINYTKYLVN